MQFVPHLSFNGECEAAFKFYEECLGGKIQSIMQYGGSPMEKHVPPEWNKKILHAAIDVGGQMLMGADAPPGQYQTPGGFAVAIQIKDKAAGERIFNGLAKGGKITMPFQPTFWTVGFGMLVDRFGTPWMINCEQAIQQQRTA